MRHSEPFNLDVSLDIRRDDHKEHQKTITNENQKIITKINSIKELNKNSILDLSELIHKHKDEQPLLLANLQPDLKSQLLFNPALVKSLEQIQRKDPINKKVKDIQNFLQKIKDEKYNRFTPGGTNSLHTMSQSMVLGSNQILNTADGSLKTILKDKRLSRSIDAPIALD